jgi:hypothetical protein
VQRRKQIEEMNKGRREENIINNERERKKGEIKKNKHKYR